MKAVEYSKAPFLQLINKLPKILSKRGVCAYIVLEQCNHPDSVVELAKSLNMSVEFIISWRAGQEFFYVMKIQTIE